MNNHSALTLNPHEYNDMQVGYTISMHESQLAILYHRDNDYVMNSLQSPRRVLCNTRDDVTGHEIDVLAE